MPYDRNADLPKAVRDNLPAAAQTVWRKTFNSALETYDGDESKAAATAWAQVKKMGWHKPESGEGKWVKTGGNVGRAPVRGAQARPVARPTNAHKGNNGRGTGPRPTRAEAKTMRLFLNDITKHQVSIEDSNGDQLIKGLPILRVGEWNGIDFDAYDLQEMAEKFDRVRDEEGVEPALKSRHTYDAETGKAQNVDAAETTLGWFKALYYDDETEALLGDVQAVDDSLIPDIEAEKLRYISAELTKGNELLGAAWVHDPAMRAMPWELVINSREWGHEADMRHRTSDIGPRAKGKDRIRIQAMGSLSASELDTRLREALRELSVYESDNDWDGPYLHQVFEDHLIVEHEGEHYRHDYSVDDTEVTVESEREEVKQTWVTVNSGQRARGKGQRGTAERVSALRRALRAMGKAGHRTTDVGHRTSDLGPTANGKGSDHGHRTSDRQQTAKASLVRGPRSALVSPRSEVRGRKSERKGGKTMREKMKALLARIISGKATEEEVDDFVESLPEGDEVDGQVRAPVLPGEGDGGGEPGEDSGLELQVTQLRKQNEELARRMQVTEASARRDKAAAQVEALVSGRHLPPALRQHAAVLLDVLGQETKKVTILTKNDEEEGDKEIKTEYDPAQLLIHLLEGLPTAFSAEEMGLTYLVDEEQFAGGGEQIEAQKSAGERLAKETNERAGVEAGE